MTNAFFAIIMKFGQEVNMESEFSNIVKIIFASILLVAFISCFFGFKIFRFISAIMAFFLTALLFIAWMSPKSNMGMIVTAFSLIGLVMAFLAFRWYRLSAFLMCALIGYSFAAMFISNVWISAAIAIVFGLVAVVYPVIMMISVTALWGGITLGFEGLQLIGVEYLWLKIVASVLFVAGGLAVQYFMNRKLINMPAQYRRNALRST